MLAFFIALKPSTARIYWRKDVCQLLQPHAEAGQGRVGFVAVALAKLRQVAQVRGLSRRLGLTARSTGVDLTHVSMQESSQLTLVPRQTAVPASLWDFKMTRPTRIAMEDKHPFARLKFGVAQIAPRIMKGIAKAAQAVLKTMVAIMAAAARNIGTLLAGCIRYHLPFLNLAGQYRLRLSGGSMVSVGSLHLVSPRRSGKGQGQGNRQDAGKAFSR
jgi:hypothetical protein